jgi:hypothetical protein
LTCPPTLILAATRRPYGFLHNDSAMHFIPKEPFPD